jgi:hypothetical protein
MIRIGHEFKYSTYYIFRSRDSVVSIATGYGLDHRGVTSSRPTLGFPQPPIQWEQGALSPGVKRPGREADH